MNILHPIHVKQHYIRKADQVEDEGVFFIDKPPTVHPGMCVTILFTSKSKIDLELGIQRSTHWYGQAVANTRSKIIEKPRLSSFFSTSPIPRQIQT